MNITKTPTVVYDEDIISKIKEIMEKGVTKLKSFIKSKIKPDLKLYNELDCEFDDILSKLEDLKLCQERRYFLSIKRMILYIVRKNSYDKDFGHCNFALELLHFFIEMFKTNIDFYQNNTQVKESFKEYQIKLPRLLEAVDF